MFHIFSGSIILGQVNLFVEWSRDDLSTLPISMKRKKNNAKKTTHRQIHTNTHTLDRKKREKAKPGKGWYIIGRCLHFDNITGHKNADSFKPAPGIARRARKIGVPWVIWHPFRNPFYSDSCSLNLCIHSRDHGLGNRLIPAASIEFN